MIYQSFDSMPLVIYVADVADTLRIGRNAAYDLISRGKIRGIKVGNQYRIPRDSFIRFVMGEAYQSRDNRYNSGQ